MLVYLIIYLKKKNKKNKKFKSKEIKNKNNTDIKYSNSSLIFNNKHSKHGDGMDNSYGQTVSKSIE